MEKASVAALSIDKKEEGGERERGGITQSAVTPDTKKAPVSRITQRQ